MLECFTVRWYALLLVMPSVDLCGDKMQITKQWVGFAHSYTYMYIHTCVFDKLNVHAFTPQSAVLLWWRARMNEWVNDDVGLVRESCNRELNKVTIQSSNCFIVTNPHTTNFSGDNFNVVSWDYNWEMRFTILASWEWNHSRIWLAR